MYNLYNFEPKQEFLPDNRKTARTQKILETTTVFLIFLSSLIWLFF